MLTPVTETPQKTIRPESKFYNPFGDLLKLTSGKRYTLLIESTFGSDVHVIHFVLQSVRSCRFDQHDNCVEIDFKPRGKQRTCQILFYGSKAYAVWEGWLELEDSSQRLALAETSEIARPNLEFNKKSWTIPQVVARVPLAPVCARMKALSFGSTESRPH